MKNTLLLIALTTFYSFQVAAQSDATEQETVDFISNKLNNYEWNLWLNEKIDGEYLIMKSYYSWRFAGNNSYLIFERKGSGEPEISFKIEISSIDPTRGDSDVFYSTAGKAAITKTFHQKNGRSESYRDLKINFDGEVEDELGTRFVKAIRHLAKLKGAKVVKEKF